MKKLNLVLCCVALTILATGCSNKKKACLDACEKSGAATACAGQPAGPAKDACEKAAKQANEQCKKTCESY